MLAVGVDNGSNRMTRASLRASERGQALVFFALSLVMLMGLVAFAIDYGRVIYARTVLQSSSDAAAAAGAQHINVAGQNPVTTANSYSSVAAQKNAVVNLTGVMMMAGYPALKCLTSSGLPQCPVNASVPSSVANNAIEVRQQVTVPMTFARVLGINSMVVTARATAGMRGGTMPPLDVMIVVDTTGSMDGACGSTTRLACAKDGVRTLLKALWPCHQNLSTCGAITGTNVTNPVDRVGLNVFPGLKASTPLDQEFDCSGNIAQSEVAAYNASPIYTIVPLSSDYRTSDTATVLNGSVSKLAKAVYYGDGNTCGSSSYGLENPGGQGSYFADAITSAQSTLTSSGRAGVQRVIIFVSDGDANRYTGGPSNPCQLAINAAHAASATGTWVYSIAYGASSTSGCSDDSGSLTSYSTMQQIASSNSRFFIVPSSGTLTAAFQKIGDDLTTTRIVSDDTP
jgi:Flp pilus assembly protein TadG